ncbi:hypothetical protein CAPTEDRAFT_103865, partial [Capitella teleta]
RHQQCQQHQFTCGNAMCVSLDATCNGFNDCLDGSDERDCVVEECAANQFQCQSQKQCISEESTCDFMLDCVDGSDEDPMLCEKVECPGMYHCPMSHCIPYHKICDGKSDCPGGQDEEKCGAEYLCEGK